MNYVKPYRLEKGDKIGIVAPSAAIADYPRRLNRGIEFLRKQGFEVEIGRNALAKQGHQAGTPQQRADDLNYFFEDKETKAIISAIGGWNSNAILSLLDYKMIKRNPKVFSGYSDTTTITNALLSKAGLVNFYGPTILAQLGEFNGPFNYTWEWFKRAVMESSPLGIIPPSAKTTEECLWWEKEDNRKRKLVNSNGYKTVVPGKAEGILIGGNLNTFASIAGLGYYPDFKGSILMFEDEEESTDSTERLLNNLDMLGILKQSNAIIFGRPYKFKTTSKDRTLYDILCDFGEKYNIPVLADIDFGHTDPRLTIPVGVRARIDAEKKIFEVLEPAVR